MSGFAPIITFPFKALAKDTGDIRSLRGEENNNFLTRGKIRTMTFGSWMRPRDAIYSGGIIRKRKKHPCDRTLIPNLGIRDILPV